jgi:GAF domain-containing protein
MTIQNYPLSTLHSVVIPAIQNRQSKIMQTLLDSEFQSILQHPEPDQVFAELLPLLGKTLQCDRCFLYLRDPNTSLGRATHCWRKNPEIPEILDPAWKPEPDSLSQEDPLFAAALKAEPSIFVEDVEAADPQIVNRSFEQKNFGHRALIHAHLRQDGKLWGILQPCLFGQPRSWSEPDQSLIQQLTEQLTPLAIAYVTEQIVEE